MKSLLIVFLFAIFGCNPKNIALNICSEDTTCNSDVESTPAGTISFVQALNSYTND